MENMTTATNILDLKLFILMKLSSLKKKKIDIINLVKEALEYNGSIKVVDHTKFKY